eukprot:3022495-Prymnesium_polylepis.1
MARVCTRGVLRRRCDALARRGRGAPLPPSRAIVRAVPPCRVSASSAMLCLAGRVVCARAQGARCGRSRSFATSFTARRP